MGSFPGVLRTFDRCYESVMIVVLSCALEGGVDFASSYTCTALLEACSSGAGVGEG